MARMSAIEAGMRVLEKEGVTVAFGVPGAAINPLYAMLKKRHTSATSSPGTWRAPRTWPRATPGRRRATSGCASAPPARPAPT